MMEDKKTNHDDTKSPIHKNIENRKDELDETEKDVEGYAYCSTSKEQCLNDCVLGGPSLSTLN